MQVNFCAPDPFVGSKELRKARRLAKSFKTEKTRGSRARNIHRLPSEQCPSTDSTSERSRDVTVLEIERPLNSTRLIPFERPSPLLNFFFRNGWNTSQICRVPHTVGFQAETVASQICSIHADIPAAIGVVLSSMQKIKETLDFENMSARLAAWQNVSHPTEEENSVANRLVEDDELLWEIDSFTGYQVLSLNPESGQRRDMVVNSALSDMLGMHREELLARLANHDLPPPYLDVDSLLVFLFTLLQHPSPGRRVKYVRMHLGGRVALVRWSTVIVDDDRGRIVEVPPASLLPPPHLPPLEPPFLPRLLRYREPCCLADVHWAPFKLSRESLNQFKLGKYHFGRTWIGFIDPNWKHSETVLRHTACRIGTHHEAETAVWR